MRRNKTAGMIARIGGKSPLKEHTEKQAHAVSAVFKEKGIDISVRTAYTYCPPLIESVIKEEQEKGAAHILVIPLFPQYSHTTTRSCLNQIIKMDPQHGRHPGQGHDVAESRGPHIQKLWIPAQPAQRLSGMTLRFIPSWFDEPHFIKAHAALIEDALKTFSLPRVQVHLLFSAHSIPEKWVTKKGDPYKAQSEKTVRMILDKLGWAGKWSLGWQSRLGPLKWIGPSMKDTIRQLGKQKTKAVLVIPVSFVSDHIETLYEIDQVYAALARQEGIQEFHRTPGLNQHPLFIQSLVETTLNQKDFWAS